jgi:hypothetical protein
MDHAVVLAEVYLQINGYFVLGLFIVLEKARREVGKRKPS